MSEIRMSLRAELVSDIRNIINASRNAAIRSVDFERVRMYWKIGERIKLPTLLQMKYGTAGDAVKVFGNQAMIQQTFTNFQQGLYR